MMSPEEFQMLLASLNPSLTCPQHSHQHHYGGCRYYGRPKSHRDHQELARNRNAKSYSYTNLYRDYSDAELYAYLRQQEQRSMSAGAQGYLTPPTTASSSESTLYSWSPYCNSPAFSDDSQYSSYRNSPAFLQEHLYNRAPAREYAELAKGCYTKEGVGVVYGQENIYTAEAVHGFVKNRRDVTKPRQVSNKVFVGGISHQMDRETINKFFARFGTVFVDWPVKGPRTNARGMPIPMASYSYLFLVYEHEQSVLDLMAACEKPKANEFFVQVPGCVDKIQIRPWIIDHGFYVADKAKNEPIIDIHRTVFVGGLPRIVTATEIMRMFSTFGTVLLVTIDIDQDYAYPKGAARVVFERDVAFHRALETKHLRFEYIDSSKTSIEIKPYVMEDIGCDECGGLWINPFLAVYDHLIAAEKQRNKRNAERTTVRSSSLLPLWTSSAAASSLDSAEFNMWSCTSPFSIDSFHRKIELAFSKPKEKEPEELWHLTGDVEHDASILGARKLLDVASKFPIGEQQTQIVDGLELRVGPELWNYVLGRERRTLSDLKMSSHMEESQIRAHLRLRRGNVYSDKSSYCKELPCRQYYCPSCTSRLHPEHRAHQLMPAGKPVRRPRKDKNMYMVKEQKP